MEGIWVQQLVNGLVIGSTYALVAVGFTLFFGTINLINFAHGDVYMLGAFAGLFGLRVFAKVFQASFFIVFLGFLFAMLFCATVGVIVERFAYKPLRRSPPLVLLISSLAVSIVLRESVMAFLPDGANPHPFPDPFNYQKFELAGAVIGYVQVFVVILSTILILITFLLVSRTHLGRSMRAISQDAEAATMMGIDSAKVIPATFILASALAAAAGVVNGMNYGSIKFDMGAAAGMKGFIAAVVGGLGDVRGAIVGGFTLAAVEVAAAGYAPQGSAYKDVFAFAIFIAVLVLRPQGILGGKIGS